LRERPEPTQLEHLSDASFLGKLLVLPANVRLDWKGIARYKQSSLFGLVVSDKGKKFYNLVTRFAWASFFISPFRHLTSSGTDVIKLFYVRNL
jgi:hypothetical protein